LTLQARLLYSGQLEGINPDLKANADADVAADNRGLSDSAWLNSFIRKAV
jgi:hypothetical protein